MAQSLFAKLHNVFGNPNDHSWLPDESLKKARELPKVLFKSLVGVDPNRFDEKKRVAVVGGGLAGLCAAYYLLKEGAEVTLFEARPECGGRVETARDFIPGRAVEAGAELIGLNHPMWLTLARDFGLTLSTLTPEINYVAAQLEMHVDIEPEESIYRGRDQGVISRLSYRVLRELHDGMDDIFCQLNVLAAWMNPYRTWEHRDAVALDNQSVADWLNGVTLKKETKSDLDLVKHAVRAELENDQGVPLEDQLLAAVRGGALARFYKVEELENREEIEADLGFALTDGISEYDMRKSSYHDRPSEYWTHSEVYRCTEGNQALADRLLEECKEAGESFEFFFSTAVKSVRRNPAGERTVTWEKNGRGESRSFPWVILAVPSSMIFEEGDEIPGKIALDRPLPTRAPQSGTAIKFLSHVKSRFWAGSKEPVAPSAFSREIGSFWEATENQAADPYTASLREVDSSHPSVQDEVIDSESREAKDKIGLSMFSGSRAAEHFADLPAGERRHQIDDIFLGYGPSLVRDRLVNWNKRPFIRTGYSCPGKGEITRNRDFFCKSHEGVIFAGEHTLTPFFGYMEGALQSGLRAAMLVVGEEIDTSSRLVQFLAYRFND